MKTVTLEIGGLESSLAAFQKAWNNGAAENEAKITFAAPELVWQLLTAKRWELLKALTGAPPLSMRAIARKVRRDVKAVHGDLKALVEAGILRRTEGGQISFPYDAVHVDFIFSAGEAA